MPTRFWVDHVIGGTQTEGENLPCHTGKVEASGDSAEAKAVYPTILMKWLGEAEWVV